MKASSQLISQIKSIVVIDDSAIDVFISTKAIKLAGISGSVTGFESPVLALKHLKAIAADFDNLKSQVPEIFFLDINMPILSGFDFLDEYNRIEELKSLPLKVFFVSSTMNYKDMERIRSYGDHCQFIPKPLSTEKVQAALFTRYMDAG
jgi:two-component SAPR family response regulator